MDDLYKKLLIVGAVFIVVLELTTLGGFGLFNSTESNPVQLPVNNNTTPIENPVQISGIVHANATVVAVRPYLIAQSLGNISEQEVSSLSMVEEVVRSQGAYVIGVRDETDLPKLYEELRARGIVTQSIATFRIDSQGVLVAQDGSSNTVSLQTGALQLTIAKPLESQTRIGIRIDGAVATGGKFTSGQSAGLDFIPTEIALEGTVESQEARRTYEFAWEERTLLNISSIKQAYGQSAQGTRNDYFEVNASALEVSLNAQNKTYVSSVLGTRVFVQSTFIDKERVISDFGENIRFPSSTLTIRNQSIEGREIQSTIYFVSVVLDENEYDFERVIAESEVEHEEGAHVLLNATARIAGPISDSVVLARVSE